MSWRPIYKGVPLNPAQIAEIASRVLDQHPLYTVEVQERPGFIGIIHKSKTAKNRRRAQARWLRREERRQGKQFAYDSRGNRFEAYTTWFYDLRRRQDGDPARETSEAAAATPAPAPAQGALTAGQPGPADKAADEAAGLVPLPEKPAQSEPPFVPNKWGQH